jgi:beta-galactosidase
VRKIPYWVARATAILALGLLIGVAGRAGGSLLSQEGPVSGDRSQIIDLSGIWQFRTDADDVGVRDRWYESEKTFPREITVPGAWNAQGIGFERPEDLRRYLAKAGQEGLPGPGSEADRLYHVYPGPGWYLRAARIPDSWQGKTVWLKFGGVHRSADIWIDGEFIGHHVGYVVPFGYDVTKFVRPGRETAITVRVDARRNPAIDPLMGCMDTLDFLYVTWGGIHRGVRLEATEDTWIEDVFAVPHIAQQTVEFRFETGRTAGAVLRRIQFAVEVRDQQEHMVARAGPAAAGNSPTVIALRIPGARLWSPLHPYLYTANVLLFDGNRRLDERRIRFGMREFKVENGKFLLNGRPFFLRGYGDDCIYPNTIAPPVNAEEYRLRLRVIRDFGFNYVRHHSWTPLREYLDAADEMGMLVQPEFPIDGPADLAATPEARRLYLKLWQEVIRQNRNHPSVAVWCMGNEIWDGFAQAPEMYRLAKSVDPTRPVIDSDGLHRPRASPEGSTSAPAQRRDTLDFLTWQFSESASFGYKDSKYSFEPTDRPVVAHEMGYFVTLPDLRQLGLFRNGLKPFWLPEALENAKQKGVENSYPGWVEKSNRLQAVCLKTNIEAARRSNLQGYHVWLFQDYPWCAEGVVDMFFRPKAVSAEEFRKFNSPTALLIDQDRRNYRFGETAEFPVFVSRYEQEPTRDATLRWEVRAGEACLLSGSQEGLAVPCGELRLLKTISFQFPCLSRSGRLRLVVQLTDSQGTTENGWDLWGFPPERRRLGKFLAQGSEWLAHLYPASVVPSAHARLPATELLVTDRWEPQLPDYLEAGGRVLLLDPEPVFPAVVTRYRPSGWDPSDRSSHVGTIFDAGHPAMEFMPSEGWCDLQFHDLIQGGKLIPLDETPAFGEPLVRAIDIPQRLARNAYLFEARAGRGRLLASGFNFAEAVPAGDPAAVYFLNTLVAYALGDKFQPRGRVPLEYLRTRSVVDRVARAVAGSMSY